MISTIHEVEILTNFRNNGLGDALKAERHPPDEGVVTNHTDGSRNPARGPVNELDRVETEDARRVAPSRANPTCDVAGCIDQVEGFQRASKRHALLQLAKVRLFESSAQLGLARQYEGQQLCGARLDIREKTNLLEQFHAQALRLVDHERGRSSRGMLFAQVRLEMFEEARFGFAGFTGEVELHREQPDEVVWAKNGVIQVNASNMTASLRLQRCAYQRALAGSRLSDEERERLCRRQPVLQITQRLALRFREE